MGVGMTEQTLLFLLAALCGMGVGLLFDLFRALRRVGSRGKIAIIIEDVLFWLLTLDMIFALVLILSDGILRGFQILGLLLGAVLYYLLLSRGVLWLLMKVFTAVGWLFQKLFGIVRRLVLKPLWKIGGMVKKFFLLLKRKIHLPRRRTEEKPQETQNL